MFLSVPQEQPHDSQEAHIEYAALRWAFRGILRLGFGLAVTGEQYIPRLVRSFLLPTTEAILTPL